MAIGSRRVTPRLSVIATVVSEAIVAPTKTPCCQLNDSYTSGATRARRPPKISAEIGTPAGSSQWGEMDGDCFAGTVYRELGCAAGLLPGFHGWPFQSISPSGGAVSIPSHQTSRDGVNPTFVKIESCCRAFITFGFV